MGNMMLMVMKENRRRKYKGNEYEREEKEEK